MFVIYSSAISRGLWSCNEYCCQLHQHWRLTIEVQSAMWKFHLVNWHFAPKWVRTMLRNWKAGLWSPVVVNVQIDLFWNTVRFLHTFYLSRYRCERVWLLSNSPFRSNDKKFFLTHPGSTKWQVFLQNTFSKYFLDDKNLDFDNTILVPVITWCRIGDKPLPQPMPIVVNDACIHL